MCNSFFAQVKLFSLSLSLSQKIYFFKNVTKKFSCRGNVFNRHACWMGSEPDKVVFQEKFHYVHIGQNLRWIFDALPIQNLIDISRAATLSPDLQNELQNLKPSRQFSENRLVFIFMNNFFFYILEWTGETGSLHAYKCKYICTEVHANLIAQSRTIYLVAMSFGENMWGETSSIFC